MKRPLIHRLVIGSILVIGLFLSCSRSSLAQQPLVEVIRNLDFGTLFRTMHRYINYDSPSAAYLVVRGRPNAAVQLRVVSSDLSLPTGESMPVDLHGNLCAYSLDQGRSWLPFPGDFPAVDVEFPASNAPLSEIHVRIGGELEVGEAQRRGSYTSNIDLLALYRSPLFQDGELKSSPRGQFWPHRQ